MNKHLRVIMTLLLVTVLFCGNIGHASAANLTTAAEQTEFRYSDLIMSTAGIEINASTGRVTCRATAQSRVATDTLEVTMTLQKQSGKTWDDVKTWSGSDTGMISMSKPYYISKAGTYRVISSTDVYNSAGQYIESSSATSKTASYS